MSHTKNDILLGSYDIMISVYHRKNHLMGCQGHDFTDDILMIRHPDNSCPETCRAGDHPARELRKRLAGRLHCWGGLATPCERVPTLVFGWVKLRGEPSSAQVSIFGLMRRLPSGNFTQLWKITIFQWKVPLILWPFFPR